MSTAKGFFFLQICCSFGCEIRTLIEKHYQNKPSLGKCFFPGRRFQMCLVFLQVTDLSICLFSSCASSALHFIFGIHFSLCVSKLLVIITPKIGPMPRRFALQPRNVPPNVASQPQQKCASCIRFVLSSRF